MTLGNLPLRSASRTSIALLDESISSCEAPDSIRELCWAMARSVFFRNRVHTALALTAGFLISSVYSASFCFRFSRFASTDFLACSASCLTPFASSDSGSPIIIPLTTEGIIPSRALGRAGASGSKLPRLRDDADFCSSLYIGSSLGSFDLEPSALTMPCLRTS